MKQMIANTALFITAFTAVVILAEIFFQFAEIDLAYHELNPRVGKKVQPDNRIIMLKEGFYLGRSNEYGYIGPAYPPEKESSTFRIALMGDSYTEGFQLFEKFHFRTILESGLNFRSEKTVEVMNFGVGNFNFSDMYVYYTNYAEKFDPDLLIFVLSARDFRDRPNFIPSPYPYLDGQEVLINYDFTSGKTYKRYKRFQYLFENSSYVKVMTNVYKLIQRGRLPSIVLGKLYTADAPRKNRVSREDRPTRGPNIELSPVSEAILRDLGERRVLFVYKERFPDHLDQAIREFGIPVIDLDRTLSELKSRGIDPNYWEATNKQGHWNYEGHRAVGSRLLDEVYTRYEQSLQ